MKELDLDKYTDKQIVEALLKLPMGKTLTVFSAVQKVSEAANKRAETISKKLSDEAIDDFIQKMAGRGFNELC